MHFSPGDRHSALLLSAIRHAAGGSESPHLEALRSAMLAGEQPQTDAVSIEARQIFDDLADQEVIYRPPVDMQYGVIENLLPDDAKIGILGDWGTGDEDAAFLLEQMLRLEPSIAAILHLGDIYDNGTPWECTHHFVNPINKTFTDLNLPRVPVFTIPGNHEYFSGGGGYYGMIDTINASVDKKWQQQASYFCLRTVSGGWQFVGADTGINCHEKACEPSLRPDELAWHKDKILGFRGKTVFMTHHQYVSPDDPLNTSAHGTAQYFNERLVKDMADLLPSIDLHLWGHDHWFVSFVDDLPVPGTKLSLRRGQLMGGSARETKVRKRSVQFDGAVRTDGSGQPILPGTTNDGLYNHTYAILDLGLSTISYYEVPAWKPKNTNPDRTCPANPLLVVAL